MRQIHADIEFATRAERLAPAPASAAFATRNDSRRLTLAASTSRYRMFVWIAALAVSVSILGSAQRVWAQGSRDDYRRAAELRRLTQNKVYRDRVRPTWLEDGQRLVYRVETSAQSHEFILVDAELGTRGPAFDHGRLAAALAEAGCKDAPADRLPLENLLLDSAANVLRFRAGGRAYRCELEDYRLDEQPDENATAVAGAGGRLPSATQRTGAETAIEFINATQSPVEIFWLDPEGERRSYGRLQPDQRRVQHTYEGHAWWVLDQGGNVLAAAVAHPDLPAIRVDGQRRIFVQNEQSDGNGGQRTRGARRRGPPNGRAPDGQSPDGRWRAFYCDHNVWLRDLQSDDESALSSDGEPADAYQGRFNWSPDSQSLVVVRTAQGDDRQVQFIESAPKDQLQPKQHSFSYLKPGDRIPVDRPQLFHVPSRRRIEVSDELFANPWSIGEIRWSADSKAFTFLYNQRGHQVLRIIEVQAASGQARALVDEQSDTFIDYAGKKFSHYLDDSGEIIWMSERDGWNHLYLYDAVRGQVKHPITRGPWAVRRVERVDQAARQIWFVAGGIRPEQDPYYQHFCRVNFDGSELTVLTEGNGTHEVRFSPDRRLLIDTWSRVDLAPVTELRRSSDGSLVCELERAEWSELLATRWQVPEPFVAKGRDGMTDIFGVIFRPSNFDPARSYPVVEDIYAGPQDSFVPKRFSAFHRAQAIAELGFIVVQIDGMGTSNRSKAFHDVCWKNLGDGGFPDRIAWLNAAAEKYPCMDLTRVGIYGGSAGGQNALRALLAHGDVYKVAVADCGCHDNRMDKIWWNELWMGWPVGPHYEQQSNVTQAHRLSGKLLLIVGENDRNVDPASTMQVAAALIRADKDFDLLVMPGTGHGAAETPYGSRRRQDFLVRHLLGVEPHWQP